MNKDNVVEAEFTEVEEVEEQQQPKTVKTGLVVAQTEDGGIHFNMIGTEQNIVSIEGLLVYARKHMDAVWADRLNLEKKVQE